MHNKNKNKIANNNNNKIVSPSNHTLNNVWEYTKERDCVFIPQYVGNNVKIYNGRDWINFYVTFDVLYHQFGKFAYTRKRCIYKNKKKKKK